MQRINFINLAIAGVFILPLLSGLLRSFSRERIQRSLASLFDNLEFLIGILVSIYLTKKVFFDNKTGVFKTIYEWIPESIRDILYGKDVLTYIVVVPLLLMAVMLILRLLTNILYGTVVVPLSNAIYNRMSSLNSPTRRIIGGMWQIPKALCIVFVFGLMLNFYSYYFPNPQLAQWMNTSGLYQMLHKNALSPVLNSNIAKQIPVIVNDSFGKAVADDAAGGGAPSKNSLEELAKRVAGRNIRVIQYFNGVTLDEAVKSNTEIDDKAREIVGDEKNSRKKANLIYKWISRNVKYDYDKASNISKDPKGISSGAVVAFDTRKGICFDYSSLYVAMCRAAGLKVRLVTGLGYSGLAWGDHAWNQVLSAEDKRWINVDATFGVVGNYFDKSDFEVDHRYAEVQGEW